MTACREFLELVSTSLDGPLPPEERTRLDRHLAQCPDCRAAEKDLQRTHSQLKGLRPVEPPPWLASKIMAKVRAEAPLPASFWRRFLRPVVMRPQFQVASILLLAATGFYLMNSQRPGPDVFKELEQSQAPAALQSQPQKPEAARDQLTPGSRSGIPGKQTTTPDLADQVLLGDSKPSEPGFAPAPRSTLPPPPPPPSDSATPGLLGLAKEEKGRARPEPPPAPEASKPSPVIGAVVGGGIPVLAETVAAPARQSKKSSKDAEDRTGADLENRSGRSDEAPRQRPTEAGQPQAQAARKEKSDARILVIRLDMPEPGTARPLIERELARAGATLQLRRDSDATRVLKAQLDRRRVPELVSRLARIGRILEQPDLSGEEPSMVTLNIRW